MRLLTENAFVKDPDDVLDYIIDLSSWLAGDTITTVTASCVQGDVVIDSAEVNATAFDVREPYGSRTIGARSAVIVWLSAGTLNTTAQVTAHLVTAAGRESDKSFLLRIKQR